jgi:regulator of nucleoside diphosphate kinase
MAQVEPRNDSPEICVTSGTYDRLTSLLNSNKDHPAAELLANKLAEATKCMAEDINVDTITMNSRVRYRLDFAKVAESRILVFPKDYYPTGQFLSVMSPIGIALLGLTSGAEAAYEQWDGTVHVLFVEDVEYQPERSRFPAT